MNDQDCEHEFVFKGIVFSHSNESIVGSSAKARIYEDAYYCKKCLENIYRNPREFGNSYYKVEFGAIPK